MSEDHSTLISAARKYFAGEFRAARRSTCLNRARLDELIETRSLPPDDVREHLFGCSECFEYFRTRLAASRSAVAPATAGETLLGTLIGKWLPWATAALVAAGLAGFVLWRYLPPSHQRNASEDLTIVKATPSPLPETPSESPTPAPDEPPTPRPSPEVKPPPPGQKGAALATQLLSIDLRGRQLLRGRNEPAGAAPILASAARNRLLIRLPEGSPRGAYEVSLVDAFGEAVVSGRARSPDGRSLSVVLDMRALPSRGYRLCLSQAGGGPSCFPFTLEGKR
jgi:hypothetical protein